MCLGAFFHITKLHPLAVFVLALGGGIQIGRVLRRDKVRGMRAVRRVGLALAAVLFVAGLPSIVFYRLRQKSQIASLTQARADAPNVVLLILDAARAANLSVYGYERPTTPTLDRFGSEGVVFETAITTAPWTGPSHASMLTGRWPFFNGISYRDRMADSLPTVAQVFHDNGYATAAFMGNANWAGRKTGFDRGFIRYDDYPVNVWQLLWSATFTQLEVITNSLNAIRSDELWRLRRIVRRASFRIMGEHASERNTSDVLAENFSKWHEGLGRRPFFAMINLWDTHDPYRSPNPARFNEGRTNIDKYDAAIAFVDSTIGLMAQRLAARGELDRTVFIVTADHGEQFGEHGLKGHGNSLYMELLHVPLVIRAPGLAPAGLRVSRVVSIRDVPATMLNLAGISDKRIIGTSLAALWRDSASATPSNALSEVHHPDNRAERWPTSFGPMKSLVTDEFHYIRRGDGKEAVYAWKGDTTGHGNQTSTEGGSRAISFSREALIRELGANWTQSSPNGHEQPAARPQQTGSQKK
jgi:arylsulfatase A-like enzyme